ncbi:hypothetical protein CEXT_258061 [Caerostris extrusa]|uniref:Uncharacterized protein n=1 Tax=Caerostris extrusa TaxID=172846 RepID=A0AAV4NJT5_CAEEX|nr:hypothetical protein CEXT_258061 [Caerostris extrusa]
MAEEFVKLAASHPGGKQGKFLSWLRKSDWVQSIALGQHLQLCLAAPWAEANGIPAVFWGGVFHSRFNWNPRNSLWLRKCDEVQNIALGQHLQLCLAPRDGGAPWGEANLIPVSILGSGFNCNRSLRFWKLIIYNGVCAEIMVGI